MKRRGTISTGTDTTTSSTASLSSYASQQEQQKRLHRQASDLVKLQKSKLQRVSHEYVGLFPTCTWDLETTGFDAFMGHILCGVVKPWGQEPMVFRIDETPGYDDDRSDDIWLARQLKSALQNYTVAIAYNGQRFDAPFLNTRLMRRHVRPLLPTVKHLDPLYAARYRMRLNRRSMGIVAQSVGVKEAKTPLEGEVWMQAGAGVKKAMDKVVKHCIQDVIVLEKTTRQLIQLMDMKFFLIR